MFGPYSLHGNKGQKWGLHEGSGGLGNNTLMSTYFKQRKTKQGYLGVKRDGSGIL